MLLRGLLRLRGQRFHHDPVPLALKSGTQTILFASDRGRRLAHCSCSFSLQACAMVVKRESNEMVLVWCHCICCRGLEFVPGASVRTCRGNPLATCRSHRQI